LLGQVLIHDFDTLLLLRSELQV